MRRVFVFATALLFIGCRDATSPEACSGPIEVTVLSAPTPTFSWSPACGITDLVVTTASAIPEGTVVWGLRVPELHPVGPTIRYGVKPRGAETWVEAKDLVVGQTYHVLVEYVVGGDAVSASGSATFTGFPAD